MPEGTGKTVRVAVFTQGAKADEARAAGADIVGFDDLAHKVKAGELDFDVVIASPDAMRVVGQLGQILGPRGLMPNPKVGTVPPTDWPRFFRSRASAEESCSDHRSAQQAQARFRQGSVPLQGLCLFDDGPGRPC